MDRLKINRRILNASPLGLLHRQPPPEGIEPPVQKPLRLLLLPRDKSDDVFTQPDRRNVRLYRTDEAIFVCFDVDRTNAIDRLLDSRHKRHLLALAVSRTAGGGLDSSSSNGVEIDKAEYGAFARLLQISRECRLRRALACPNYTYIICYYPRALISESPPMSLAN